MTELEWVAGFRTALVHPGERIQLADPRGFDNQTLRQVLHMAGGGTRIRVRLTNRYSDRDLVIGTARIALRKAGAEIVAETDTEVRFAGSAQVRVPAYGDAISDPIDMTVTAGTDLALSLYLPEPTGLAPYAQLPNESGWIATGDRTADLALPTAEETTSQFFVTGVDVLAPADTPVLVAFGDSWFQGTGSTHGANRRSVDVLNERLSRSWVVNQGSGGNRLLTKEIGESGLARFERDVLAVPGVRAVLVNFGINDLILDERTTPAEDLIAGFTELAQRAHDAGLPVYANTIGPFGGAYYPGLAVETGMPVRREVNAWLRGTDVFDAVFDVAAAVQDPDRPDFLHPEFDGDGMHLNDAGARAMAGAMDLTALDLTERS
ncbi:SGNH/GDSL hydrolase family protein [Nocardia uniformis]|uniref:SGNH/GDSL hydrolase family protein n=1 Tax=Nocardia uniformis TaxID=53432 RepID=A0A849BUE4_9NOCA|nr:GDSL-type esterase/lipase family protein [Nocardia uniformis]NNH70232.1 SGNH/GDSL hydrolase family protein [Nocardia uniformis]